MKKVSETEKNELIQNHHLSKFGFNGNYLFDSWVETEDEYLYFITNIKDGMTEIICLDESELPEEIIASHKEQDILKKLNSTQLSKIQVDSIVKNMVCT